MRNKQEDLELAISQLDNNFSDAWNVISELANGSYEPAMEFVADCYYRGKYVNMDETLAFKWFSRIIETYPDNGDIYRKIGDCYCYGYGVSENHDEALFFYQQAWDKGAYNAGSDIGWLYAFGELSNHDECEAGKWFQRAGKGSRGPLPAGYSNLREILCPQIWHHPALRGHRAFVTYDEAV